MRVMSLAVCLGVGVVPLAASTRTNVTFVDGASSAVTQADARWWIDGLPATAILVWRSGSGHKVRQMPVVDGRADGLELQWYEDGRLESVREYRAGAKVGRHRAWWPDGTPRFDAQYRADAYHGEYRTWHENGRLYEHRWFAHGREEGAQRAWTPEGEMFLNYEVRQGRRYGFINARPCVPVTEAVQ